MAIQSLDEEKAKHVLRQVEFYFSDSNLPRDNFLSNIVKKDEDGWVDLSLICSFARMKKHLGLHSETKAEDVPEMTILAVAELLRTSNALKVSEDGKRVARSSQLLTPDKVIEQVDSRTVAVSPLEHNTNLEDVETFFGKYGKVNSVRLPRHIADKRYFCGTALVEFSQEEDAEKILKETISYGGLELEIKPKKDFDNERASAVENLGHSSSAKNDSADGGRYPKGVIIAFKLKKLESAKAIKTENKVGDAPKSGEESLQNAEMQIEQNVLEGEHKEDAKDVDKVKNADKDNEEGDEDSKEHHEEDDKDVDRVKNADKGLEEGDEDSKEHDEDDNGKQPLTSKEGMVMREDLKKAYSRFGTVKFIDFKMGDDSGYIRFEDEDSSIKARAASALAEKGGLIVKGHIVTVEAVTGDAEKEYWSTLRSCQVQRKRHSQGKRKRN